MIQQSIIYILGAFLIFVSTAYTGLLVYLNINGRIKIINASSISLFLVLGTSIIILLTNIFSNLGFNIRQISIFLLIIIILLTIFSWKKFRGIKFSNTNINSIFLLLGVSLIGSILTLLPIIKGNSYVIIGDPYTYISISEYLQNHGIRPFVTSDEIVNYPYLSQVFIYQQLKFRLGAIYFLSLVQNLLHKDALLAFPLATAWGVYLCSTSVFLFIDKYIKQNRIKFLYLLIFNVLGNPIISSAISGFLPQTFGVAGFLVCVYFSEDLVDFDYPSLILYSIYLSYLTSVYSELIPITLIITAIICFVVLVERWRSKSSRIEIWKIALKSIFTVTVWILISNIEFLRFTSSIYRQASGVVGWHISLTPLEWLSYMLGFRGSGIELSPVSSTIQSILTLITIGIISIIVVKNLIYKKIPISLFVSSSIFLLFLIYFGIKKDPWTQELGQTWSLYKLIQWFYPFTFILLVNIFQQIIIKIPIKYRFLPLSMISIIIISFYLPKQLNNLNEINYRNNDIFEAVLPLNELNNLTIQIKQINPMNNKSVLIVSETDYLWPKLIYTYYLREFMLFSNWNSISYFPQELQNYKPQLLIDNTICLLVGSSASKGQYDIIKFLPADTALVTCTPDLINFNFP